MNAWLLLYLATGLVVGLSVIVALNRHIRSEYPNVPADVVEYVLATLAYVRTTHEW